MVVDSLRGKRIGIVFFAITIACVCFLCHAKFTSAAINITNVSPDSGLIAGGTNVTITGSGFEAQHAFGQVSAGGYHSLALDRAGDLYTWGRDDTGQVGNGSPTANVTTPWQLNGGTGSGIPDTTKFKTIATGNFHSMAIDEAGNLYTWGQNNYGQIGNGNASGYVDAPWQVNGSTGSGIPDTTKFKAIAGGAYFSLAIDETGNLYAWGYDNYGQIGNGSVTGNVTTPWQINGGTGSGIPDTTKFKNIIAGSYHSLAIDEAGNLYVWGYDNQGQIGNGSVTGNVTTPWKLNGGAGSGIPDTTKFKNIAGGAYFSMAIDEAGNLYVWGQDNYGQIGNGSPTANVEAPWQVNGGTGSGVLDTTKFKTIAAGNYHSMAIDEAGNLYVWGYDAQGQIGNGSITGNVTTPWQLNGGVGSGIPDTIKFAAVAARIYFSVAIDESGNLYAWGQNNYNQIGSGSSTSDVTAPKNIMEFSPTFVAPIPTVSLGGSTCIVTSWTNTEIVCTTSAHAAGLVDVTIDNSIDIFTLADAFTYIDPTIPTPLSPDPGSPDSNPLETPDTGSFSQKDTVFLAIIFGTISALASAMIFVVHRKIQEKG